MPFLNLRFPSADPKLPPALSRLFHTNAAPSESDAHRIHRLLQEREAELAAFAGQIEHARAQLLRLEQEHDRVHGVVHELHALLSPVRRMPTDIMAKIFEHCVADPRLSPLLLAQVCRAWRYLLFSLPCLWTAWRLDLPHATNDWEALVHAKSMAMHVWFSRSRALPISLCLRHAKASPIPWHALMHLDKEILSLGSRLKHLSLHFSARSLGSLLTFTHSPLPHLEHLELHNGNSLPTNDNPPPIVLHSAPNLHTLSISWSTLDLRDFDIPWSQLHHLNLGHDASPYWNPIHSDYLHVLARCPNLTTLSLGVAAPINDVDPSMPAQPVTLPRLHTFHVSLFVQTPYLAWLFDALRLPQLRHIEIKNVSLGLGSFTGQTECLPLLARCADTLESVCFNRADIADAAVMSCLGQLDRLKTLSFLPGILRLNHGLIGALTHEDGESGSDSGAKDGRGYQRVCPELEVLELRCSSVVPIDAIVRLVASRCRTTPKLKRFSLQLASFEYGLDKRDDKIREVQARLQAFVEDGLELDLSKRNSNST